MNDLFRAIFGIPSNGDFRNRGNDKPPENYRNNFRRNLGDDDDNDDYDDDENHDVHNTMGPGGGFFDFPIFNDTIQIQRHLERLVNEMNKAFGVFGFGGSPSITWEGDDVNSSPFTNEEPEAKGQSLRDAYLKRPDCGCENRDDGRSSIRPSDFEPGTSQSMNSPQFGKPKVLAVVYRTVRRSDGSVETVKKITDSEGNEQTIVSHSNVNDPPPQIDPLIPKKGDDSGLSIFRKFFSF